MDEEKAMESAHLSSHQLCHLYNITQWASLSICKMRPSDANADSRISKYQKTNSTKAALNVSVILHSFKKHIRSSITPLRKAE